MGKTIIITGAGDGLGRALARRFARDGETVILLGRTLSKLEAVAAELGEGHLALQCDVGDPDSVRAAFAQIATRHPKVDVLINNASVVSHLGPLIGAVVSPGPLPAAGAWGWGSCGRTT